MANDVDQVSRKFDQRWEAGDHEGALSELDEAIRLDPQNATYRFLRGMANSGLESDTYDAHKQAINDFTVVIEHSLNDDEKTKAYRKRALSYMVLKQYPQALEDLNWLIDEGFDSNFWVDLRSQCKREAGFFQDAVNDFTEAINYRKTNELLLERAETFIQMGNVESVLQDLSQPTDFYKDHNSLLKRAQLYYQIGHYEESILDFTNLIEMNSSRPSYQKSMYFWRGKNYYQLNRLEEALHDFTQMSFLDKETPFTDIDKYIEYLELNA